MLKAFEEIADESFKQYSITNYDTIPFNDEKLHDVLLRNLTIQQNGKQVVVDVAIRQNEKTIGSDYYVEGIVEDIGDLQDFYGYHDLDVSGMEFVPAKIFTKSFASLSDLDETTISSLLEKGYATVIIEKTVQGKCLHGFPIRILSNQSIELHQQLLLDGLADFFIRKEEKVIYAVINGYVIDLEKELQKHYKNLIF